MPLNAAFPCQCRKQLCVPDPPLHWIFRGSKSRNKVSVGEPEQPIDLDGTTINQAAIQFLVGAASAIRVTERDVCDTTTL